MYPSPDELQSWRGQFRVTPARRPDSGPPLPGWTALDHAGLRVEHHPGLPVASLAADDGEPVGLLLGWATDGGRFVEGPVTVGPSPAAPEVLAWAERHGGRWLLLYTGPDGPRVYPDPCGTLACVYREDSGAFASTGLLLGDGRPADHAAAYDIPREDRFYAFGLTGHEGVRRLLPNHHLDLSQRRAVRHYVPPRPDTVAADEAAEVVVGRVREGAAPFAGRWGLYAGLTAGHDSRALLACLAPLGDRALFFTNRWPNEKARGDHATARRLARIAGAHYATVCPEPSSQSDLDAWQARVGGAMAGQKWRNGRNAAESEPGRVLVPGSAGEVGRAFYYRRGDGEPPVLTADRALRALKQPDHPAVRDAYAAWAAGLPDVPPSQALDLLYLENRVGAWASPSSYGNDREAPEIVLFSNRLVVDAMLALSVEEKRADALPEAVVRLVAPDLLALPFNRPVGWRSAWSAVNGTYSRAIGAARFRLGALRKRFVGLTT